MTEPLTATERAVLKEAKDWMREHEALDGDGCRASTDAYMAHSRIGALVKIIDRVSVDGEREVDLADVFGYGPSAPGWKEPAANGELNKGWKP